jgi:hypothetical protein
MNWKVGKFTVPPCDRFLTWTAVALVVAATSFYSISTLLWTVRAGVPQLSANSEFFAYSWIYGIRWGAGELHVFQPHSQLILPIYGFLDHVFSMTTGDADHILTGWRRISLIWPIVLAVVGLILLFATIDRKAALFDVVFSAAIYLLAVPLFLSDHALNSLSYHSLAVPLALAALPLWRYYNLGLAEPPLSFYALLGTYTAISALGKPTFLAFATPFYAMELMRSFRTWRVGGLLLAGIFAVGVYMLWMFVYCRSIEGLIYQFSKTYEFMRGQANWYDVEKGATPFNWYAGYVIGKMGPLPTALTIIAFAVAFFRRDRAMLIFGILTAIASAMFCLYQRSQLHAQPEFIGLLMTVAIASFRATGIAGKLQDQLSAFVNRAAPALVSAGAVSLIAWTIAFPPQMLLHGFAEFMGQYDAAVIPNLFEKPQNVRTIALQIYPVVFWGSGDAWCRGSVDIFGGKHSPLLDNAFGNLTCMQNQENPEVDIGLYNRAMFPKETKTSMDEALASITKNYPHVAARFVGCHKIVADVPTFEIVECGLR